MVSQTLFMQLEGVRHQLRVPKAYLEDPWDWAQGAEHTAQLFRVTTEGFEPVTRRRSSEMMRAGNRGFYRLILHDFVPLEELLNLHLRLFARDIDGMHPDFDDAPRHFFKEVRSENNLAQLVPLSGISMFRDIFVARAADGRLTAVFTCTQPGDAISPGCVQDVRIKDIDTRISYRRTELPRWEKMQGEVADFIGCLIQN